MTSFESWYERTKDKRRAETNRSRMVFYYKHRKEESAAAMRYYHKNREKLRNKSLMKQYGITISIRNAMIAVQEGKCAICFLKKKLAIDHCHTTGRVRALLCQACNRALGMFKDDPNILQRAVTYVTVHSPTIKLEEVA